ncbi:Uncharacterized protein PECH_005578 [Penicillium ucsense]|uniref:Uncharacterized protein n=1 Tax=Penicillium ucsense TaxID=2839758 RepID=A0A8J8WIT3_9EURO|nr:Uncharacterized protein PECM_002795 [Penicillium ucsense]KAF7739180.1 Uncharacterized protein PECH_005578 [Penicillium ucsense]
MQGLAAPWMATTSTYSDIVDLTLDDGPMDIDNANPHSQSTNGLSQNVKPEPSNESITFVSKLAHKAPSSSPQKPNASQIGHAGIETPRLSAGSGPAAQPHLRHQHEKATDERTPASVSTTFISFILGKRKSPEIKSSDQGSSIIRAVLPPGNQNGPEASVPPLSAKTLGKRPMHSLRTPSPRRDEAAVGAVSVVIPSPSTGQKDQLVAAATVEFTGLSEEYFPTGREEQAKSRLRAYPSLSRSTPNRRMVPFTMTVPAQPGPLKRVHTFSVQKNVPPPPSQLPRSTRSPTPDSLSQEPMSRASIANFLRRKHRKKLKRISGGPDTRFDVDDERLATLSANFFFIGDYRLGHGVNPVADDFLTGCDCGTKCDPQTCSCLVEELDSDELIVAYERRPSGTVVLREDFMDRKAMISECSSRCLCAGHDCWNHVVQRGRQVRLEVFDTGKRGLGLRSLEPLVAGQFIDCYWGEVLTKEAADAREAAREGQPSYLFSLDWLIAEGESHLSHDDCYVVDSLRFGGASRFINHSCNPNCKIIPVSVNRLADHRLYYLGFFAIRDILAKEELTFDYHPNWDGSKQIDPSAVKCLCGEPNCRGQLWPNSRKKGN